MSMILLIGAICCFSVNVFAATSGKMNKTTITVTTNSKWSLLSPYIKLQQNKAEYTYTKFGKTKTGSMYGVFNVTIKDCNTGKVTTKKFDGKTLKISLKRNTTYKITVAYDSTKMQIKTYCKMTNFKWKTTPNWWVSKAVRVSNYY